MNRTSIRLAAILLGICASCLSMAASQPSAALRPITTHDLATVKEIKTLSLAPDRRHIAYQIYQPDIDSNSYHITWHVAAIDPKQGVLPPMLIAGGGEPIFGLMGVVGGGINGEFYGSPVVWSPDGKEFAYTLKKNDEIQLWMSRVDRPGRQKITHSEADVRYAAWSEDGMKIFYAVGRKRIELTELRQEEREQGALTLANAFAASIDLPEPPPCEDDNCDEAYLDLGFRDPRACKVKIWTLDLKTGRETPATTEEEQTYRALTARERQERERYNADSGVRRMTTTSRDGKRQAWVENVDPKVFRGQLPPQRIAVSVGGQDVSCYAAICRSFFYQGLWWSGDDERVVALAQTEPKFSVTSLFEWQPAKSEPRVILQTEDQLHNCQYLATRLICIRQAWTSPDTIASVSLADGRITTLEDPNPDFEKIKFTRIEKHAWKDAYGNTALAHLVFPKDYSRGVRYPLIITTYATGGFLKGAVGDEQPIHVFAQNGFFVLSFEVPDDEESQAKTADIAEANLRAFTHQLFEQGPSTALDSKLDELDRRGLIDPARVGITSFSFGANLVDTALVHSHRYAAASGAWSPISPGWAAFAPTAQKKGAEDLYGGDFYGAGLQKWREHGIAFNAEKINVPFLIQTADREYFVSLQNFMALKNAGKPVEMYRFADEYHVKWQPVHRYVVYNRNVDWFNFWLRDVESGLTADPGQYSRWHALREQHRKNLSTSTTSTKLRVQSSLPARYCR